MHRKILFHLGFIALSLLILVISNRLYSQEAQLEQIISGTASSFRALAVVDDNVIWVSGSNGYFGRSIDGGKNWKFNQVNGFEDKDFRSLYALDKNQAILCNAGSPAFILKTIDGGENWFIAYANESPDIFFDGIDFWNSKEGIIYGDPIDGRMSLLHTIDGGNSWLDIAPEQRPVMKTGESSFAASGSAIRCFGKQNLAIVSGGIVSRLFISADQGLTWQIKDIPIIHGDAGTGAFSIAVKDSDTMVVVGGDYTKEEQCIDHILISQNGGNTWRKPKEPTKGYRESVEYLDRNSLIATGPSGTEISNDDGETWQSISGPEGMHVVRKSKNGLLVVMAGKNGKIFLIR